MKKLIGILAACLMATASNAAIKPVTEKWTEAEKDQFREMFVRQMQGYEIKNVDNLVRETNFIECMLNYYSSLYSFEKLDRWNQEGEVLTLEEQNELTFTYIECHYAHSNETSKGA